MHVCHVCSLLLYVWLFLPEWREVFPLADRSTGSDVHVTMVDFKPRVRRWEATLDWKLRLPKLSIALNSQCVQRENCAKHAEIEE